MRIHWTRTLLLAGLTAQGCGDDTSEPNHGEAATHEAMAQAVTTYAELVRANYEDSLSATQELDETIDEFIADPSEERFVAAQDAWRAAREPYGQTEVYRFYDGPIEEVEGLMNAWPMDEAYVDYVEGDEDAGVINNPDRGEINTELLISLNEAGGEQNIATGYHAIEFLLWGQDGNEDGPGDRPYTDYVEGDGASAPHPERRAQYLQTVSELLVDNLQGVTDAWTEDEDNFRKEFEEADAEDSFARLLVGMTALAGIETGGERLRKALDSGDQEDEHSCFSDNTHRDMVTNVIGIQNVLEGRYERLDGSEVNGTGVYDVVATVDEELAEQLRDKVEQAVEAANELVAPFDQEIALDNEEGHERVRKLIDLLSETQDLLEDEVAPKLDLTLKLPE